MLKLNILNRFFFFSLAMFFSGVFLISVMIVNIASQDKNKNFVLNVHKDFFIEYDSFKEVNFAKITKNFLTKALINLLIS